MTAPAAFEAEIVEIEPQPTAAVRIQQPMSELDLAAAFDRAMPLVAQRIVEAGGSLGGPPFGRYHRFGPDVVDAVVVEGRPGRLQRRAGRVGFTGHAPDYPLRGAPVPGRRG